MSLPSLLFCCRRITMQRGTSSHLASERSKPMVEAGERMTRRRWGKGVVGVAGTAPLLAALAQACASGAAPAPAQDSGPATVQFYFGTAGPPEIQLYTTIKEGYEKQYPKYKLDLLPADN